MKEYTLTRCLQATYDALPTYDSDTLYFCTNTGNVYLGSKLLSDDDKVHINGTEEIVGVKTFINGLIVVGLTLTSGSEGNVDFYLSSDTNDTILNVVVQNGHNVVLRGIVSPKQANDAANKEYVDEQVGGIVVPDVSGKADKVSGATNGNFAGLDSNGNLTDIGKKASDFATAAQGAKADTAVQSVTVGATTTGNPGTNAEVTNSGTSTAPVLNFTIPRGADGVDADNPFKGWYDYPDLPSEGGTGCYCYVQHNGVSTVYRWRGDNPGGYVDTQESVDAASVSSFKTAEEVNNVSIDSTHLTDIDVSDETNRPTVPKATDVLNLKSALDGTTRQETKAVGYTVVSGKFDDTGSPVNSTVASRTEIVLPQGTSEVRFLGMALRSGLGTNDTNFAYAFGHYTGGSWVTDFVQRWDKNSVDTHVMKEYIVAVPDGATHFRTEVRYSNVLTTSNFYCYFSVGVSVKDLIEAEVAPLRAKLNGVEITETLANPTEVGTLGKYIKSDNTVGDASNWKWGKFNVEGYRRVRFVGRVQTATGSSGFCFTDENDVLISGSVYIVDSSLSTAILKEYIVDIPDGAVYFKTNIQGSVMTGRFYCYLLDGDTAAEKSALDALYLRLYGVTERVVGDDITSNLGSWNIQFRNTTTLSNTAKKNTSSGTNYTSKYIGSTLVNQLKATGSHILVRKTSGYDAWVTFIKKNPPSGDLTLQQLIDNDVLCSVHHNTTSDTWNAVKSVSVSGGGMVEFEIPQDCLNVIFTKTFNIDGNQGSINRLPDSVTVIDYPHTRGDFDDINDWIAEIGEGLEETNQNLETTTEELGDLVDDLYGVIQEVTYTAFAKSRKGSLDPSNFYAATSPNTIGEVSIEGYKKVVVTAQTDRYCIVFVSKSKLPESGTYNVSTMRSTYMAECEGFSPDSDKYRIVVSANTSVEFTLNDTCKYLYVSKRYDSYDRTPTVELVKDERVGGKLSESSDGGAEPLKLYKKENKWLTRPIPLKDGVMISVREPYRVTNAWLLDHLTGKVVNDHYRMFTSGAVAASSVYRRTSDLCCNPSLDVVYQIQRFDDADFSDTDGVIDEFAIVDGLYTRKMPEGISKEIYLQFKKKLQTSVGVEWTPLSKVPVSGSDSAVRYKAGTTYKGINYSGPTQWGKHLGIEVSMRTFMTALANKRSVMYTERIGAYSTATAKSAYGYNHESFGREAGAFYGCVCTGLTSYLLGLNHVITSSLWKIPDDPQQSSWGSGNFDLVMKGNTSTPTVIEDAEGNTYSYDDKNDWKTLAGMLQPMDFIWKDGHCAVISDVYVDDYGDVRYIVISEQTSPYSVSQPYPPEFFFLRFKGEVLGGDSWQVLRRKASRPWTIEDVTIPRTGMDAEVCMMDKSRYTPEDMAVIDPDISTFAGEYAVFVIGDYSDSFNNFKLYLNIRRGGSEGYTHLQVFNEDDETMTTPIADIDISSNGGNVAQSNIVPDEDPADKMDYIVYNLANYWNTNLASTVGKFKARVVRKESGTVVAESGFSHFIMVKIEMNIVGTTLSFSVNGGVPVVFRREQQNGLIYGGNTIKNLSESDYEYDPATGEYTADITLSWVNIESGFFRLFVKTDYGMANRRFAIS
jgi:hypothetical protein